MKCPNCKAKRVVGQMVDEIFYNGKVSKATVALAKEFIVDYDRHNDAEREDALRSGR